MVAPGRVVAVLGRVVLAPGRVDVPVPGRVEVLVLGRLDAPVLGRVEVPVLGRLDVPVLGRVEVPVLGRLDVPVPGRVEELVPRDPEEPIPELGREVVAGCDGALVLCPVEPCCCGAAEWLAGAAPLLFFCCAHISAGTNNRPASKAFPGNFPLRRTHLITTSSSFFVVGAALARSVAAHNLTKPAPRP